MKNKIELLIIKKAAAEENPALIRELHKKLQEAWGVSPNKVTYILRNRIAPSAEQLVIAAQVLDVPMEKLIVSDSKPIVTK